MDTMLPMRTSVDIILPMRNLCEYFCSSEEFVYTIVRMSRTVYIFLHLEVHNSIN